VQGVQLGRSIIVPSCSATWKGCKQKARRNDDGPYVVQERLHVSDVDDHRQLPNRVGIGNQAKQAKKQGSQKGISGHGLSEKVHREAVRQASRPHNNPTQSKNDYVHLCLHRLSIARTGTAVPRRF
jgi:hypothetical protein